jgi:glycosyltransferase involved in cell wall biosynthesis
VTRVLELRSVRGTGGGPEKTILFGAARHDQHRFAITVCYIRDARDEIFEIDQRARKLGLDYVEILEQHSLDRSIWPKLVSIVRDRRIDIIHGHDHKTNLLAWLLGRKTGAIALATSHGWTGDSRRERWLYYPIDRQVMRRLPRVIAVSSEVRDTLVRAGAHSEKLTVLLNGIDPSAFKRTEDRRVAMRASLGVTDAHHVIGAVGRAELQKRFDLLIEAFAALRPRWPNARLVIVGDGSLRVPLEQLAVRLGVADACVFTGHRLDIADLHTAFDVFVQSSEYEGTPNAVLEAMAMESPIVATDVGGTRELAFDGEHGLIVPSHDVPALIQGIEAVLAAPDAARKRAIAARARVEGELSFARRTELLEAIYDALMAERSHTGTTRASTRAIGAPDA